MVKTISQIMNETGMKRNQIMLLVHSKDSRWFRMVKGGIWQVEEEDFQNQIDARKGRAGLKLQTAR